MADRDEMLKNILTAEKAHHAAIESERLARVRVSDAVKAFLEEFGAPGGDGRFWHPPVRMPDGTQAQPIIRRTKGYLIGVMLRRADPDAPLPPWKVESCACGARAGERCNLAGHRHSRKEIRT